MVLRSLLLISSILFLSSCSAVKQLELFSTPVKTATLAPADPRPLTLDNLHFDVVTKDNIQEYLAEVQKEQDTEEYVFYGITPRTYELLAFNMQELKRYILQQKEIILFYKKVVE